MRRTIIAASVSLLALVTAAPALAQDARDLAIGADIKGELSASDPRLADDDDARYDDYRVAVRAGQRLEAVMRSSAFDAYLAVYAADANGAPEGEPRATDDDGLGEGTDSRLRFTADRDGAYVLRARSLGTDGTGAYTLSLIERPAAPPAPRPATIRVGDEVKGELTSSDPEQDDGSAYDAYALSARAGQRFAIGLNSEAFDPVLRVGRAGQADVFEELAKNDDAPSGGLNSFLIFTAPDSGDYLIRATGLNATAEGDYTLTVADGPPPAPVSALRFDTPVRGRLTVDTPLNEGGQHADAWRFRGREGQRVVINLTSDAFDTYLQLFRETNGSRQSIAEDDDSGAEGTNSRIAFTLPATGDYVVEARAFSEGTGAYQLKLEEATPEPPPGTLTFGATISGEIGDRDPRDDENRGFDAYRFRGEEGRRVQVIVRSGDFDAFVAIGKVIDGQFVVLGSDDDGLGEGTDARLSYTTENTSEYIVRASPLGSDGKGLYSIELIDQGPEPKPGSIVVGGAARGTLGVGDSMAEDGSYYEAYRLHAKKDEKLNLTLVSNDFDAYVSIGRIDDGDYTQLEADDDGLSDTHARLEWTAPEDGEYEVRAGSFAQGETGAYALMIDRKP
ncbi:MAG: peptidase [Brevundimonas sp.]|uniref:PPC domain-containing protein n=1 Tax=Brevundimonas sp. TaxID=1871086 RepID=UPI0011FDB02E|nr:PPC domain-containing protein [Brevundimonas sp.]RZJ16620.1 MAG: peptidase [Brevundimonas sp.]